MSHESRSKKETSLRFNSAEGDQICSQVFFSSFLFLSDKNTGFPQERTVGAVLLKAMGLFLDFSYVLPFLRQFDLKFGQKIYQASGNGARLGAGKSLKTLTLQMPFEPQQGEAARFP